MIRKIILDIHAKAIIIVPMGKKLYEKPNAVVSAVETGDVLLESGGYFDVPDDIFFEERPTGEP